MGALLVDEEGRVDLAGGVAEGDDEIPQRAGHPLAARAVLVRHHPGQGLSGSSSSVSSATLGLRDQTRLLQGIPGPRIAAGDAVAGLELFGEVLGRVVGVVGLEPAQRPTHLVDGGPPGRRAAQALVRETLGPRAS